MEICLTSFRVESEKGERDRMHFREGKKNEL